MKTLKIYASTLLALLITTAAHSQDGAIASAKIASNEKEMAASTAAEGDVEEQEEEDEPTFTLSGSIDTYFRSGFGYKTYAPATAFANRKGFGLGMANLIASYGGEKVGFTADLVFGPRGKDAVFLSEQGIVNQLYAYYRLSDKVTLNMGQFNTFLGYEVISPTVNFNYSTSYMFSYGPFSHTGLRADFDLGGGLVGKLAIMNPTDVVEFNPINTYTLGAQIGHTTEAGGIWLNLLYGDQDGTLEEEDGVYEIDEDGNQILDEFGNPIFRTSAGSLFQADITAGYNLSDNFYLGVNTSYQTVAAGEQFVAEGGDTEDLDADATSFFGIALYPKVTLSESFALGLRAEYFSIQKGHLDIIGLDDEGNGSVTAITLSANYKVGALTIIPELRMDKTSEDSFADKSAEAKDMLSSFTLAAVYKF